MASARGRGLRPGGVVRALLRLMLFVAVGFGVGLLFGIVTEEPALLAGHLSGEGESVSLTAEQDVGELPYEGAARPDQDPTSLADGDVYASSASALRPLGDDKNDEKARALPAVAARATAPDAPAASPASAQASVAERDRPVAARVPVSATRAVPQSAHAAAQTAPTGPEWAIQVGAFSNQQAATRLAEGLRNRYPVAVLPADERGGRWRVRVQPISEEAEAREIAKRLKRDESLPTWVTAIAPDSSGAGSRLGEGRSSR